MIQDIDVIKYMKCGEHSALYPSNKHYKYSKESICWEYSNGEPLEYNNSLGYTSFVENNKDQLRSAFSIWIYNEVPVKDKLIFKFSKDDNYCCECYFNLDFTGWRTAWVIYDRDMVGQPLPGMNKLTIIPPKSLTSGELYISNIITSSPMDPRHPTTDFQVPFVNQNTKANGHWLDLFYFSKQYVKNDEKCSQEEIECMCSIENRYIEYLFEMRKDSIKPYDDLITKYKEYNIKHNGDIITGNTIDAIYYYPIVPAKYREDFIKSSNSIRLKETFIFLLELAISYQSNTFDSKQQKTIKKMFLDITKHVLDQGFIEGSSLGTTHHFGYIIRHYFEAMFLMRDIIKKEGMLDIIRKTMAFYCALNRIFDYSRLSTSDMDILNTLSQGMLATILLIEDTDEKAHYLKWYKKWVEYSLAPAKGLFGPFKIDGSIYHHCNHYPAYGLDGLKGITPVIYFLSRTEYSVSIESHELIKKALLYMRLYSNKINWLVSLCARHPKGKGQHTELIVLPFKYMALAGSPDGKSEIDYEVASAYMRLLSDEEKKDAKALFNGYNVSEEVTPNGHWTMNYSCLSLHRRQEWLIGVRGHNRYLWSHESYIGANLYGRYITFGQIQVLGQGNPITNEESGYVTDGFNWNRWQGTTTIQLPFDELKSDVRNVDDYSGYEEMLLTDEIFAGGLNIENKQGMFAMKLHEHEKYDGSHRLNLSVFMFDNRVICLGSNINNDDDIHDTNTTLYQNHMKSTDEITCVNGVDIIKTPYEETIISDNNMWLLDNKENGYYIPRGQEIQLYRDEQHSKAQDTCKDTKGLFASAVINHSKAPKDKEYEYTMLIKATKEMMKDFCNKMSSEKPIYSVISKNSNAHIVKDNILNITGYALFNQNDSINIGYLVGVDVPCMVMIKEDIDKLVVSIVDPDLRLYNGIDDEQYDSNGIQKEVSVYSRKWIRNSSKEAEVTIIIKNIWNVESNDYKLIVSTGNNNTMIKIMCKEAIPVEFTLVK
ncbi:MAG: polysaccharide lyase beta-sandwich domain-containing protein [Vallitalea sp.]|jgi:chondroitin-sulfate-ABC endolyase/exolyase|nr:polysaccharide lyase beta-sandwich domain-containing protein [Vallitalea sp.]